MQTFIKLCDSCNDFSVVGNMNLCYSNIINFIKLLEMIIYKDLCTVIIFRLWSLSILRPAYLLKKNYEKKHKTNQKSIFITNIHIIFLVGVNTDNSTFAV